jgi:hypothetical protein
MFDIVPLSGETFDIVKEWYLETPTETQTQILLECFINKDSLRRCKNPANYYQQKLHKRYSAYDLLLNLYNRKCVGLLQQTHTNELLVEYKVINSFFDITSSSGAKHAYRLPKIISKRKQMLICVIIKHI